MAASLHCSTSSIPAHLHATLEQMEKLADSVRRYHHEAANGADLGRIGAGTESCGKALAQMQSDLKAVSDKKIQRDLQILQLDYDCLVDRINCAALRQRKAAPAPLPPTRAAAPSITPGITPGVTSGIASGTRPYLRFEIADCILAPSSPAYSANLYEFQSHLERLGLYKELNGKIVMADGLPTLRFPHPRLMIHSLRRADPKIEPYLFNSESEGCFHMAGQEGYCTKKGLKAVPNVAFDACAKALLEEATSYFTRLPTIPEPVPCEMSPTSLRSDTALFEEIFNKQGFDGVCVGEHHRARNPKKFIIDNLSDLKRMGVTTLFMEHLCYDAMQPLLDAYFASPSDEMPTLLKCYLHEFDLCQGLPREGYSFSKLVHSAKAAGIRVVGLDTISCKSFKYVDPSDPSAPYDPSRLIALNYVAKDIIAHEKGAGKYIALIGSDHGANMPAQKGVLKVVPGIANLSRCPFVVVDDLLWNDPPSTEVNIPSYRGFHHVHVLLQRQKPDRA